MWSSPAPSAPPAAAPLPKPASVFGDINGVRLTKADEVEQYAQESLKSALDGNDSGRHVARVAHLYLASNQLFHLSAQDWEVNLLALCSKVFGPLPTSPPEFGWFGSVTVMNWAGKLPANGQLLWEEIDRDVDVVFAVENNKYDSENLKALRLIQLLHPQQALNFFHLCYNEDSDSAYQQRPNYRYPFPLSELSPHSQEVLRKWHLGKQQVFVPELFVSVCGGDITLSCPPPTQLAFLHLSLSDWFTFRFLNWFAMANVPSKSASPHHIVINAHVLQNLPHNLSGLLPTFASAHLPRSLREVLRGNAHLELLSAYMDYFFRTASPATPRQRAIFRWSVGELWLSRPMAAPKILLDALRVLVFHLDDAPEILQAFTKPLVDCLLCNLRECVFEDSFGLVCGLIRLFLAPWNRSDGAAAASKEFTLAHTEFVVANAKHYSDLVQAVVDRFDSEPNPSWPSIEAFLGMFDAKSGVFTQQVFDLLTVLEQGGGSTTAQLKGAADLLRAVDPVLVSAATSAGVKLSAIRPQLEGVVREISYKQNQHQHQQHLSPSVVVGSGSAAKEQLLQLSRLFQVPIPSAASSSSNASSHHLAANATSQGNFFSLPDRVVTRGVPTWISSPASTGAVQFRRLTQAGKKQILEGTRDATVNSLQYVGDYALRPVEQFEIPVLVYLVNQAKWGGKARSILADSRNVLWFLVLAALVDLVYGRGKHSLRIILLSMYCLGAGVLRGVAGWTWALVFAAMCIAM
ncbi:hypothetical protein BASA81_000101 [Batrachochytrium salamandrivorans]|nr:hypothetical protein BASA81_000101 [Batrachochytrium salamandrivorans]